MKLILLVDVPNVGKKNEIVEVNDGYGKNFLIKKGFAVMPTKNNMNNLEKELIKLDFEEQNKIKDAKLLKAQLESIEYTLELKVNNSKTFGVITNKNIVDLINKDQVLINKFMISESHKLTIGHHVIKINIYKDIIANIKLHIRASTNAK